MKAFLVAFLLSWVLGIVLGVVFGAEALVSFGFAAGVSYILAPIFIGKSRQHLVASICVSCLGVLWGAAAEVAIPLCPPDAVSGEVVEVRALESSRAQYVFRADQGCTVFVTTGRFPEYQRGDQLEIRGEIQSAKEIPEEYEGYSEYLQRQGIAATIRYPSIVVAERSESGFADTRRAVHAQINRIFLEPEAGVMAAMVLGQRGGIPDSVSEQLRRSGVSHILAISGLHISLMVGMILVVMRLLPISSAWRLFVVLVLLWGYIFVLAFPASATRAALFWTVTLLAVQSRALVSLPTILIAAVTVMISAQPLIVFDVGFQLSVAAVSGIGLALFITRKWKMSGWKRGIIDLGFVSLGATLATWPITVAQFGSVSLVSVLANMLVVPIMPLLLALGVMGIMFSFAYQPLGIAVSLGVRVLWKWIDWATSYLGNISFASLEEASVSWWIILVYYCGLIIAVAWTLRKTNRSWREMFE